MDLNISEKFIIFLVTFMMTITRCIYNMELIYLFGFRTERRFTLEHFKLQFETAKNAFCRRRPVAEQFLEQLHEVFGRKQRIRVRSGKFQTR